MQAIKILKLITLILSIIFSLVFFFLYVKMKKSIKESDSSSFDDSPIDQRAVKRILIFFYCYAVLIFVNIVIQIVEFILNFSNY